MTGAALLGVVGAVGEAGRDSWWGVVAGRGLLVLGGGLWRGLRVMVRIGS